MATSLLLSPYRLLLSVPIRWARCSSARRRRNRRSSFRTSLSRSPAACRCPRIPSTCLAFSSESLAAGLADQVEIAGSLATTDERPTVRSTFFSGPALSGEVAIQRGVRRSRFLHVQVDQRQDRRWTRRHVVTCDFDTRGWNWMSSSAAVLTTGEAELVSAPSGYAARPDEAPEGMLPDRPQRRADVGARGGGPPELRSGCRCRQGGFRGESNARERRRCSNWPGWGSIARNLLGDSRLAARSGKARRNASRVPNCGGVRIGAAPDIALNDLLLPM